MANTSMKYEILRTTQFKKDYQLAIKRGCNIELLMKVVSLLENGEQLPSEYRDTLDPRIS